MVMVMEMEKCGNGQMGNKAGSATMEVRQMKVDKRNCDCKMEFSCQFCDCFIGGFQLFLRACVSVLCECITLQFFLLVPKDF